VPKALCVGHACYDLVLPFEGFPEEDRKYVVTGSRESSGGPACNAASLLGLYGVSTAFAGLVGDDLYGERVARDLASAGIDIGFLERRKGHPTPVSLVFVNRTNGSRTIVNRKDPEAFLRTTARDFSEAFAGDPPLALLFDGHEPEASSAAVEAFPEAFTVLDAGSLRSGTDELSKIADFCIASERFALEISGFPDLDAPERLRKAVLALRDLNGKRAAVTLGGRGCAYLDETGTGPGEPAGEPVSGLGIVRRLPALSVEATDSTAAGDIFHGSFVKAALEGKQFAEALLYAGAVAGLSVTKPGGRDSIPPPEEAEEAFNHLRILIRRG